MLNAMRNNDEFAFANYGLVVAKLHAQHALDYEEEFIFDVMMMPDEFAFDLDDLHRAIVNNAQQALIPKIGETAEFFLEINGLHGILPELPTNPSQCRSPRLERAASCRPAKSRSTNGED